MIDSFKEMRRCIDGTLNLYLADFGKWYDAEVIDGKYVLVVRHGHALLVHSHQLKVQLGRSR